MVQIVSLIIDLRVGCNPGLVITVIIGTVHMLVLRVRLSRL